MSVGMYSAALPCARMAMNSRSAGSVGYCGPVFLPSVHHFGLLARVRARVESVAGSPDTGVELFEEGLRVDAALGARPCVTIGRIGLAEVLFRRGEPGDVRRARELAARAAADAASQGLPGPAAKAGALFEAIERGARACDPLTAREREVADLVAHAVSNRAIAQRLVVRNARWRDTCATSSPRPASRLAPRSSVDNCSPTGRSSAPSWSRGVSVANLDVVAADPVVAVKGSATHRSGDRESRAADSSIEEGLAVADEVPQRVGIRPIDPVLRHAAPRAQASSRTQIPAHRHA
jgi:hypothetical protein